ncbi:ATP-binding protein [Streptomyces sp. H10-C2]|uniref:ATP-binding protein n=1 Tax=unclassified Streptomyces TaxID=2593676 RepID=UPI0024B895A5|nr:MULTISPECIES: ATP-binding protein [unclassified Streptomyces]MDJ0346027.1 ATP-binding protein [Streptomyces sp. PH10-H1]MDJ0372955.1 ATP-binding protein [Streptomyces sp. H10-C2]
MASSYDALRVARHDGLTHPGRHDVFRLPAQNASVADARGRVRARLREWGVDLEVTDDAGLVVTELFTNAVRHTDSEKITCSLWALGRVLRLEVADQGDGPTEPRSRSAEFDEECGRGLLLVSVLSKAWGAGPTEDGMGRVVWAELACAPARRYP